MSSFFLEKLEDRVLLSVDLPVESTLIDGSVYEGDFDSLSDVDSFSFSAQEGQTYHIRCESRGTEDIPEDGTTIPELYDVVGYTDSILKLYDSSGNNVLVEDDDSGVDSGSYIEWTAPTTGTYYVEASPFQQSLKDFDPGNYTITLSEGNADWTVMVYFALDNNLEWNMSTEFTQILDAIKAQTADGIAPSVNIVAMTDGSADYDYSDFSLEIGGVEVGPYDFDWYESTIYWSMSPHLAAVDIGEQNTGDAQSLIDFIDWSVTNYSADNYALILRDHGGQYLGVCEDEDSGNDIIKLSEIDEVTEYLENNNIHLGLSVMAACDMAGIEPAWQYADFSDYYVAAEPTTYSAAFVGFEFLIAPAMTSLMNNSQLSSEELGIEFVDTFSDFSDFSFGGMSLDMYEYTPSAVSLVESAELEDLVIAVDAFSDYMITDASDDDWQVIYQARNDALQFENDIFYNRFCDLGDLMEKVSQYSDNTTLDTLVGNVNSAVDDAVSYILYDRHAKDATGLTISLPTPQQLEDFDGRLEIYYDLMKVGGYNNNMAFLRDTSWDRFIYEYLGREISTVTDDYADSEFGADYLVIPAKIDGTLGEKADQDYFSFTAAAGTEYSIHCDSTGIGVVASNQALTSMEAIFGIADPLITIYDADGNILASDDDSGLDNNAALTWTAPSDGTYYISVSTWQEGMTPFTESDYTLTIRENTASWTVMLYMAVDNNLDDSINEEIYSLVDAFQESLGSDNWADINIVAFTDGFGSAENSFSNSLYWQIAPALAAEDMGELDSGSPVTLVDFVDWAEQNYPADNYLFIDNDHGGNIFGMDWDDTSESNISAADFTDIASEFATRDLHIDVMDMAMCVMAGTEIAYQARNITDFYVSSEPSTNTNEYIGACDNIYGQVSAIMANPAISPNQLAHTLVDLYREDMPDSNSELDYYPDSISMVETAYLDELVEAVDSFSSYMMTSASSADWQTLADARTEVTTFDPSENWFYSSLVDLGHLMTLISNSTDNAELKAVADSVLTANNNAVPYHAADKNAKDAMGLTIYLPDQDAPMSIDYTDFNAVFDSTSELDFAYDTCWDEMAVFFCKFSSSYAASTVVDLPSGGLTFTDADGTRVSVRLSNANAFVAFDGTIEQVQNKGRKIIVTGSDLMLDSIVVGGGSIRSTLKISTSGGTIRGTELGWINDDVYGYAGTSLKNVSAPGVTLTGGLDIDGWLGSLRLGALADNASIYSAGETDQLPARPVSSFNIAEIGNDAAIDIFGKLKSLRTSQCQAKLIAADEIGTIKVAHSGLAANVYSYEGDIKKILANGDISGRIYAFDEIGRILNRSGSFTGTARSGIGLSQFNFTEYDIEDGSEITEV